MQRGEQVQEMRPPKHAFGTSSDQSAAQHAPSLKTQSQHHEGARSHRDRRQVPVRKIRPMRRLSSGLIAAEFGPQSRVSATRRPAVGLPPIFGHIRMRPLGPALRVPTRRQSPELEAAALVGNYGHFQFMITGHVKRGMRPKQDALSFRFAELARITSRSSIIRLPFGARRRGWRVLSCRRKPHRSVWFVDGSGK